MRIRTIKPEFWESETLGKVSREARLLFVGLFSCCDDSGRTRASSRLLASRLFPYDDDACRHLPRWLAELEAQKCVRLYQVDGEHFLEIPKWLSHQKIEKPTPSKLPTFTEDSPKAREDSRGFEKNVLGMGMGMGMGTGNGNREQEEEQGTGDRNAAPPPTPDPIPTKTLRMISARPVLHLLNECSGRQFRETESNLLLIAARLEEPGVDLPGVLQMVRRQCAAWGPDPKMSEFLRPETLFGKTKFESYYANRHMPAAGSAGGRNGHTSEADRRRSLVPGADDVQRTAEESARRDAELVESGRLPI